jgi:transposase
LRNSRPGRPRISPRPRRKIGRSLCVRARSRSANHCRTTGPRQEIIRQPEADGAFVRPDCGAGMAKLGEDATEVLDYVPGRFQVIRHFRPKYACKASDAITQAPGPAMPTPRGRATPAMLAHLLVSKYCDHLPLYRPPSRWPRRACADQFFQALLTVASPLPRAEIGAAMVCLKKRRNGGLLSSANARTELQISGRLPAKCF